MQRYISFFIFSTVLCLIALWIQYYYLELLIPHFWVVFFFFVVITFIALTIAYRGIYSQKSDATVFLLTTIVVKMIGILCFATVYIYKFQVNSILFIINFFSLYLCFSCFEVKSLLINLRHEKKT